MLEDFLKEREVIFMTLAGSHAYGTNVESSDIDLRGIALRNKKEILGFGEFKQFTDSQSDTVIYSADRFIQLALNCNPNIIELLGTREQEHKIKTPYSKMLIDNREIFLSKLAIKSFHGYATAQLRRLENYIKPNMGQSEKEKHLYNTVKNMQEHLINHYTSYNESNIKIYIDESSKENMETELFLDLNLQHYPLRDYANVSSEMVSAIRAYDKIGKRNKKKSEDKLDKHVMHLMRLNYMLLDMLEKKEIITYREKEHDILMDMRNGKWSANQYERVYHELDVVKQRIDYAKKHTELPDKPDYEKAEEILMFFNRSQVR